MKTPALRLTDAAKAELSAIMAKITEFRPIATVFWSTAATRMRNAADGEEQFTNIGPHWGVGFYSSSKVPLEDVVEIDGVPFTFAQGGPSMRLDGAVLDYAGGKFVVTEAGSDYQPP